MYVQEYFRLFDVLKQSESRRSPGTAGTLGLCAQGGFLSCASAPSRPCPPAPRVLGSEAPLPRRAPGGLPAPLVCYPLQVEGWRRRPGDGGDEAAVAPELQAGGLVALRGHGLAAPADPERLVSLAVPERRLLEAVARQGPHVAQHLVGERKAGCEHALTTPYSSVKPQTCSAGQQALI